MNTPEPTPKKPRFTRPTEQIEEIDLTGSPEPRRPPKEHNRFDVELYILNNQQSLRNSTTIWYRDDDGTFRAKEHDDLLAYLQARKIYLNKNNSVNSGWAEQEWKQWLERDSHPAVDAFTEYNEPAAELAMLQDVTDHLHDEETALRDSWTGFSHAQSNLRLAIQLSNQKGTENLLSGTKNILKDLAKNLRVIERSRQLSTRKVEELKVAVKSLVKSKANIEKPKRRKRRHSWKMMDTVDFVKECLDNHCNLVSFILGRPDPLVQQGTDLMQSILSELVSLHHHSEAETEDEENSPSEEDSASESEESLISESESVEEDPESELEQAYKDQHDTKHQKRHPPLTRAMKTKTRPEKTQSKLILGKVEKSKTLLTRKPPNRSASPHLGSESDVEYPKSVRRNPERKARNYVIGNYRLI